jgi:hypothetical protein
VIAALLCYMLACCASCSCLVSRDASRVRVESRSVRAFSRTLALRWKPSSAAFESEGASLNNCEST